MSEIGLATRRKRHREYTTGFHPLFASDNLIYTYVDIEPLLLL
jgi:hypothetical protein